MPVRNVELPLEPEITEEEIQAVLEVLKNKQLSQLAGSYVEDFEVEFARYMGTKYAVAVNSGTSWYNRRGGLLQLLLEQEHDDRRGRDDRNQ